MNYSSNSDVLLDVIVRIVHYLILFVLLAYSPSSTPCSALKLLPRTLWRYNDVQIIRLPLQRESESESRQMDRQRWIVINRFPDNGVSVLDLLDSTPSLSCLSIVMVPIHPQSPTTINIFTVYLFKHLPHPHPQLLLLLIPILTKTDCVNQELSPI